MILSPLKASNHFRPELDDVERFVKYTPKAKAIFVNTPHNPTMTEVFKPTSPARSP